MTLPTDLISVTDAATQLKIGKTKVKSTGLTRHQIGQSFAYSRAEVIALLKAMPDTLADLRRAHDLNWKTRTTRKRDREGEITKAKQPWASQQAEKRQEEQHKADLDYRLSKGWP